MQFERLNPLDGSVASSAPRCRQPKFPRLPPRRAPRFRPGRARPQCPPRRVDEGCCALEARADAFVEAMMGEIGATKGWAMFNLGLPPAWCARRPH
jgi:hypothetical protein